MKMIFHCGDVHLGAASRTVPDLTDRQFLALEALSAAAIEEKAASVVVAGDLFDSPHVPAAVIERLGALVARHPSLPYVVISGTHGHDSYENERSIFKRGAFASYPGNFHLLDRDRGYTVIDGIAYYSAACDLSSRPAADHHVLVFHGTFEELSAFLSSSPLKGFDYAAMGHFHYFREYRAGNLPACHCGTLHAFEWPAGTSGVNESACAGVVLDPSGARVTKRGFSDARFVRSFVSRSEHLDRVEGLLTGDTWLALYGSPRFKEEAEKRFGPAVRSLEYHELQMKDIPDMLVRSIEEIVARQEDESVPWDEVKETAMRLLAGEEGKDFLNPNKYLGTL